MPGPAPKAASARRRRNRASTAVVLVAPETPAQLPVEIEDYSPPVRAWLRDLAQSPMAAEFDASDVHNLIAIAELMETFWALPREKALQRAQVHRAIMLGLQEYGLTPLSRRRLQWEIERGEAAAAKTKARRVSSAPRGDPRLKVV